VASRAHSKRRLDLRAFRRVLLPEFFQYGGCTFVRYVASGLLFRAFRAKQAHSGRWSPDRTGAEALENHVHPLDLVAPAFHVRMSDPLFREAEEIGKAIAHVWCSKLMSDFPGQQFRVYYARSNNPSVRFHRSYRGESPWLEEASVPEELARGHVLILQTPGAAV